MIFFQKIIQNKKIYIAHETFIGPKKRSQNCHFLFVLQPKVTTYQNIWVKVILHKRDESTHNKVKGRASV